ncbi:MAG: DUF4366 domain-containing protein [Defluviitaleaceae bacterium]|nr:DUF4366 domain-containing protein [Defluviitaleaceae bacterium]
MKAKYVILLALMFCVGAFLFPATVYASQNGNPPTVNAAVEGDIIRIEASGGFLGVEAIFINDQRFNFRVDGVLRVDLIAFRNSDTLSIHAVDFAGNVSNVVGLINPHYIGLQPPPQSIPVTSSNPFTPAGQASVLDNATDGDDKEFFTFTTPAGNVFFLIVDRQRGSDNVYFLNAVTEQDLITLAAQNGTDLNVNNNNSGGIPVTTTPQIPNEQQPEITQEEPPAPPPADKSSNNGTLIFMLVAIAVAGGAGYYLKIVRPKKQKCNGDYDDEDEDEEDTGEEMEFETEAEAADDVDEDYYNTDEDEPKTEGDV